MIFAGRQSTWPKLLFIKNRMKIERLIDEGLLLASDRPSSQRARPSTIPSNINVDSSTNQANGDRKYFPHSEQRRASVLSEIKRQSRIFFDDPTTEGEDTGESDLEELVGNGHLGD